MGLATGLGVIRNPHRKETLTHEDDNEKASVRTVLRRGEERRVAPHQRVQQVQSRSKPVEVQEGRTRSLHGAESRKGQSQETVVLPPCAVTVRSNEDCILRTTNIVE